jgi:hypothetical protein
MLATMTVLLLYPLPFKVHSETYILIGNGHIGARDTKFSDILTQPTAIYPPVVCRGII